jgi:hypothetical protein
MTKKPVVQSRLKQYYVLKNINEKDLGKLKKGEIVGLHPEIATPYIGARVITPLSSALREKLVTQASPKKVQAKTKEEIQEEQELEKTQEESSKKTLVKNTLRKAVQEKKETVEPKESSNKETEKEPEEEKEEETTTEEVSEPSFSKPSTSAEDAIKAQIEAAKAKKKK